MGVVTTAGAGGGNTVLGAAVGGRGTGRALTETGGAGLPKLTGGGERKLPDAERESACNKDCSGGIEPPMDNATDPAACGPTPPGPPDG
jgi:hypothetical protein